MKVRITAAELVRKGMLEEACKLLNISAAPPDEQELELTQEQAQELGLIQCDDEYPRFTRIRFMEEVEIEVVENYDEESDTTHTTDKVFARGQEEEVEIIAETETTLDVQFNDGSVAFNVLREYVEELDDSE